VPITHTCSLKMARCSVPEASRPRGVIPKREVSTRACILHPSQTRRTCLTAHRYLIHMGAPRLTYRRAACRGGNAGVVLAYLGELRTPAARLGMHFFHAFHAASVHIFSTTIHMAAWVLACYWPVLPCFRARPCWLFATPRDSCRKYHAGGYSYE
jgi:hypothetical protein